MSLCCTLWLNIFACTYLSGISDMFCNKFNVRKKFNVIYFSLLLIYTLSSTYILISLDKKNLQTLKLFPTSIHSVLFTIIVSVFTLIVIKSLNKIYRKLFIKNQIIVYDKTDCLTVIGIPPLEEYIYRFILVSLLQGLTHSIIISFILSGIVSIFNHLYFIITSGNVKYSLIMYLTLILLLSLDVSICNLFSGIIVHIIYNYSIRQKKIIFPFKGGDNA